MTCKDFPFGRAASASCWRMLLGVMLTSILLPLGVASATYSYQLAFLPSPDDVTKLADGDLRYWFAALALFSISSWTVVVRWLLNQIVEQRKAYAIINQQMIDYMRDDHSKTQVLLAKVEGSHNRLANALDKIGVEANSEG